MKLTDAISQIQTDNKISSKKKSQDVNDAIPSAAAGRDRVELSSGSLDVQKIQEILQETPDIRLDKIQELKEKIELEGGEVLSDWEISRAKHRMLKLYREKGYLLATIQTQSFKSTDEVKSAERVSKKKSAFVCNVINFCLRLSSSFNKSY